MPTIDPLTRFADLAEREIRAHDHHVNTEARLDKVERALSKAEQAELALSRAILAKLAKCQPKKTKKKKWWAVEVCDPLFVATRTLLNEQKLVSPELRTQVDGVLVFDPPVGVAGTQGTAAPAATAGAPSAAGAAVPAAAARRSGAAATAATATAAAAAPGGPAAAAGAAGAPAAVDPPITLTALTLGLLITDGVVAPPVKVVGRLGRATGANAPEDVTPSGKTIYPEWNHASAGPFTKAFFGAIGEARSYGSLADKVLVLLAQEGDSDGPGGATPTVRCAEFAQVMRKLFEAKVDANEPQLRRRVNEMLDQVQNVGGEDRIADLGIDLPDLEDIQDENLMKENVRCMGPMIVSTMFDELKVFQVVDRIVEQFQAGQLPIGPGEAGRMLYQYWRDAPNRMSEQERRSFAAITIGGPGGDPGGMVNREFNDLWIRFVSSVSSFIRQNEVDSLLRSATPSPISHQQVRKAARDLASNLSLHGYGMAHYAAREVQAQVGFMIRLLSDPEIRAAYGAKDMWQVIDQVATYDLGGAKTSSRYRTLATCGTIITAWLANNVERINRTTGPLLNVDEVRNPPVATSHKATREPNDYDLVNACELWLADTATPDSEFERLSQAPRNTPTMTSKPIPIPQMAREMLEDLGDIGIGLGRGYTPERPASFATNGHSRPY